MAKAIIMPKFEMSQEFGTIVEWLKSEGDEVKRGEPILTVETDKVTMDVESSGKGILAGLRGEPGDTIPVTETIGWILGKGEVIPSAPKDQVQKKIDSVQVTQVTNSIIDSEVNRDVKITPVAMNLAKVDSVSLDAISGSGRDGKIRKQDVIEVLQPSYLNKIRATPAARNQARKNNIDLSEVVGTGPKGRVQEDDVLAFVSSLKEDLVTEKIYASIGETSNESDWLPYSGIRKKIGDNLQGSYQNAPHVFLKMKIEMNVFNTLREEMNLKAKKQGLSKVSITALLTKMIAVVLKRNPIINSTLHETNGTIELKKNFNIGVAVALDDGLIVPVVKNADLKTITSISDEILVFGQKAKAKKLTLEDISGGSFTISNLGPYGIAEFTSIINPGQSAILAVGATMEEVRFNEETGEISNIPILTVTLSIDHRVIDGAVAAKFLVDLKEIIEMPGMFFW